MFAVYLAKMALELNSEFVIKSETLDEPLSEHNNELHGEIKIKKEPFEEHDTEFDSNETFGQNTTLSGNEMDTDNIEIGVEGVKPFEIVAVKTESFLAEPVTDNSLTCGKCIASFTSQLSLNGHVCKIKRIETFTCNLCSNKFVTRDFLQRHLLEKHNIDENSAGSLLPPPTFNNCEICCLSYKSNDALQQHYQSCHRGIVHQSFKCTDCGINFRLKSVLEKHMNIVHGVNITLKSLNDTSILQNLLIKPPENPSTDNKCKSSTSFEQNVSTVCKDLGQFKCTKCQKYFTTRASLIGHLFTHNNTEPLEDACETNLINIDKTTLESIATVDIKSEPFDTEIDGNETFGQNTNLSGNEMDTDHFEFVVDDVKPFKIVGSLLAETVTDMSLTCGKCNETFMNQYSFDDHCNACLTQNNRQQQILTVHSDTKLYRCEICSVSFNLKNLKIHFIVIHKITDNVILNNLLSRAVLPKEYICEICNKKFKNRYTLKKHKHTVHHELQKYTGIQCTHCEACFTAEYELNKHLLIHEKPYECSICVKGFSTKYALKRHLINEHTVTDNLETKTLQTCQESGKQIYSIDNLEHKQQYYQQVRTFKCKICKACFLSRNGLKFHSTLHSGKKTYKCSICSKHYRLKSSFRYHLSKAHHLNDKTINKILLKPLEKCNFIYQCNVCHDEFISFDELKEHKIVHDNTSSVPCVKYFQCDKCDRINIFENLEKHNAVYHSEDNSFKCSVCKATFNSVNNLKIHLSSVHGKSMEMLQNVSEPMVSFDSINESVKCEICKQDFNNRTSLKCHFNKMHKNNKELKCDLCGETFRRKSTLRRHFINFHKTVNLTSGLQRSSPKPQLRQSTIRNKVRQPDCKSTASSLPEMWITKVKPCSIRLDHGEVTRYLSRLDKREVTEERGSPIEGLPPPLVTPAPPVRDDPRHPCGAVSVTSDLLLGTATSTLENVSQEGDNYR